MKKLSIYILKISRKLYAKIFSSKKEAKPDCIQDPNISSELIYKLLNSEEPCMIARFGSTEMACLSNYMGVKNKKHNTIRYIQGKAFPWWWEPNIIEQMQRWSGFFPPTEDKIEQFCELMLKDISEVDILGSWISSEKFFKKELQRAKKVRLYTLEPFWSKLTWTRALAGKKVLVVHPFAKSIEAQYKKRELLFENKDILPAFELKTIPAVQTLGGGKNSPFADWFEALEYMKAEIDKTDYDICLIAAGAYGFPLAAHVKRKGKKGFHMGGSLQLMFGLLGKRWENPIYGKGANLDYSKLFNKHWTRPNNNEQPQSAKNVEDACYW